MLISFDLDIILQYVLENNESSLKFCEELLITVYGTYNLLHKVSASFHFKNSNRFWKIFVLILMTFFNFDKI